MDPSHLPAAPHTSTVHTPLPWSAYGFNEKDFVEIGEDKFNYYRRGKSGPLFFCIHGAGYTGLSFAQVADHLAAKMECQIIAPDIRGHGETKCVEPYKLSKDQVVSDLVAIYEKLFPDPQNRPYAFVIGHSMGGAMAIRLAHNKLISNLMAVIVIDVVEGTAIASLRDMPAILKHRPRFFDSLEEAIIWSSKNHENFSRLPGARQTVPSQLYLNEATKKYHWITDLSKTQPFWHEWFTGMSEEFLACSQNKILIIGDADRLDTALTRAEMQGKYQNVIVRSGGHSIHENCPAEVVDVINNFYQRFAVLFNKNIKIHI